MKITYFLLAASAVLFSSCIVSKKKFDDVLAQKVKVEGDLADRNKELEAANASIASMQENLKKMRADSASLDQTYKANQKKLEVLNKEFDQLNTSYKNLLLNCEKLIAL